MGCGASSHSPPAAQGDEKPKAAAISDVSKGDGAEYAPADKTFDKIDTNMDGSISKEELQAYLQQTGQQGKAERIFACMDSNEDGQISRAEFRAGFLQMVSKELFILCAIRWALHRITPHCAPNMHFHLLEPSCDF